MRSVISVIFLFIPLLSYADGYIYITDTKSDKKTEKISKFKFNEDNLGISIRGIYSSPIGGTNSILDTSFGPEIILTYRHLFSNDFHAQLVSNYNHYFGKDTSIERFQTITVKLLGRYDATENIVTGIILFGYIYFNAGLGTSFESVVLKSETLNNTTPVFHIGVGYETNLGKTILYKQKQVIYLYTGSIFKIKI